MTVIPFRVRMRARVRLNDALWSEGPRSTMIEPGEAFYANPRRAAELLSIRAAELTDFDPDDVAAVSSFTPDPDGNTLKLAMTLGLRPN